MIKSSEYKGVSYNPKNLKKPWKARIQLRGEPLNIGQYDNERTAGLEVDKFRILHGMEPINILIRKL